MSKCSWYLTTLAMLLPALGTAGPLNAEEPRPAKGPHTLRLPEGEVRDGLGRRVWVRNEQGERVVAKVHC